ncbi:hypothetical protein Franean1_0547 [Parafrankia sp. EAN1pec]|nr:hypothetical protein Franean1_0547 [Frankia sp. EAN1pec]
MLASTKSARRKELGGLFSDTVVDSQQSPHRCPPARAPHGAQNVEFHDPSRAHRRREPIRCRGRRDRFQPGRDPDTAGPPSPDRHEHRRDGRIRSTAGLSAGRPPGAAPLPAARPSAPARIPRGACYRRRSPAVNVSSPPSFTTARCAPDGSWPICAVADTAYRTAEQLLASVEPADKAATPTD